MMRSLPHHYHNHYQQTNPHGNATFYYSLSLLFSQLKLRFWHTSIEHSRCAHRATEVSCEWQREKERECESEAMRRGVWGARALYLCASAYECVCGTWDTNCFCCCSLLFLSASPIFIAAGYRQWYVSLCNRSTIGNGRRNCLRCCRNRRTTRSKWISLS